MDMTNKLCVITGANSGIGFETARKLAEYGAFIVMVCRNEEKAQRAKARIQSESAASGIDIIICDFSTQDDIRKAAGEINSKYDQIDVLINNHGFIASEYVETVDGLEETFAVNHIGYFLFTNLLLDTVKAAENGRIINVASQAHRNGVFDPENLQLKRNYSAWQAYANSKLFNILFTTELAERLKGTTVTANCLHPGVINSNFGSGSTWMVRIFWKLAGVFMKSSKEGARTTIYLAASEEAEDVNGAYFKNSKAATPKENARDKESARQLWAISEELSGLK